jgi:hypothetical protein
VDDQTKREIELVEAEISAIRSRLPWRAPDHPARMWEEARIRELEEELRKLRRRPPQ